jgi:hypothetical protein
MKRELKGRCLCGETEYLVADEFAYSANCHCSRCRRMTGAAFKSFAGIEVQKFRIVRGADSIRKFGDGPHDVQCGKCGSFLYSILRDAKLVHVNLGTLTDVPGIRPSCHIFVGSKAPWFEIADDLPQFEGHET